MESQSQTTPLRVFTREMAWNDEGDIIDRIGNHFYIKHLGGAFFFGFVSRFSEMIKALPNIKLVVIRMGRVPYYG